jgi:zinc transport system substrate-binding protein
MGLILASGCEAKKSASTATKTKQTPVVYTTFYPVTYFTQRIGGDKVRVACPCPADADPATWMPDQSTLAAYQTADLIVVNGAAFEEWLEKATLPETRIVDTAKPFADEFIVFEDTITHTHGPEGEHAHEGIDGHTWLDPVNAKAQAGEIRNALVRRFPEFTEEFENGYAALARDLDALDARLKALAEKMGDQPLFASHAAYNYIGRRYGWRLENFHLDPQTMPDEDAFGAIKETLQRRPAKCMLWEAQPVAEIADRLRGELGLESIVFSPCESPAPEEFALNVDFLYMMNANLDRLQELFGP